MQDRPGANLQFDQADYGKDGGNAGRACESCKEPLGAQYFLANGHIVCERCSSGLSAALTGGSGAARAGKAIVLGLAAGALGAAIYFGIAKLTGYEIGLIALVVGFLVGVAVRKGSEGRGGWPYQTLAIAITYAAIVLTYVPMIVSGLDEEPEPATTAGEVAKVTVRRDQSVLLNGEAVTMTALAAELRRVAAAGGEGWYHREGMDVEEPGSAANQVAELFSQSGLRLNTFSDPRFEQRERWSDRIARAGPAQKVVAWGFLFGIAAAAPFLMLPSNLIGLLIIAIALFEAWKLNKRATVEIKGPFQISELAAK